MSRLQRWWQQRFLRKHRIPLQRWERCLSQVDILRRLDSRERRRLRELASRFLHDKHIVGARGQQITEEMRVLIAAQACLLILNLDLDYFAGWREIIVYPDNFVVEHQEHDEAGVVHHSREARGGESWAHGPVILSWADSRPGAYPHGQGSNIILHEFAHKLDMLNGATNGMPPLHAGMSRQAWTETFSAAYDDLETQLENHHHTAIDPYAAEGPAEFFAVVSETFFEQPQKLVTAYPEIYTQLSLFYRQDPLAKARLA